MDDGLLVVLVLVLVGLISYLLLQPKKKKTNIKAGMKAKKDAALAQLKKKVPEPIPMQLVLLLDTTSSMGAEIEKCKKNLSNLVGMINHLVSSPDGSQFIKLEIGFVSYKDKRKDGTPEPGHLEGFHPFSYDVASVQEKIAACTAMGGGDLPEDIRGGLEKALSFEWSNDAKAMKVICIIADDPCHGRQFHKIENDNFPEDSENMLATLQTLVDNRVSLLLSSITNRTATMSAEFSKFYVENKPVKVKGDMGIAFREFDLNRNFGDEEFTKSICQTLGQLFDGNVDPEMKQKLQAMAAGMAGRMAPGGGDKKED